MKVEVVVVVVVVVMEDGAVGDFEREDEILKGRELMSFGLLKMGERENVSLVLLFGKIGCEEEEKADLEGVVVVVAAIVE